MHGQVYCYYGNGNGESLSCRGSPSAVRGPRLNLQGLLTPRGAQRAPTPDRCSNGALRGAGPLSQQAGQN